MPASRCPKTVSECKALGGEIIGEAFPGGPKLCKIDVSKVPECALPWQKKGYRVITVGEG